MALETATYLYSLVITNPDGGDQRSTADDHIRLIKAALKRTFPNIDGEISASAAAINNMVAYGMKTNTTASVSVTHVYLAAPLVKAASGQVFALGPTYGGYFAGSATALSMPPGWTVSRSSQGQYLVTHSLNINPSAGGRYAVSVAPVRSGGNYKIANIGALGADDFTIQVVDTSLSAVDVTMSFILTQW